MIRTSQPGTLRAAVNIANRALVQANPDGSFKGPSADIAIRLAAQLAVDLRFVVYQSAAQIYAATDRDEWDIAFLASDPQRRDRLAFSIPYLTIQATLLTRADRSETALADFDRAGARIAAARGAAYEQILRGMLQSAEVVAFDTPAASFRGFLDHRLDAVVGIRQSLEANASSEIGLRLLQDGFASIEQCVAVPIDHATDLPWIERHMAV
ncbi:transporter substrate-binding domain-containing protein [Mesorhizobium sp. J428]|uniref:transporter substrate-binding domain-containing protein n=1 Tax=Mesorhizobium sp. J428 TaxID=2898440 RepID=UPI0021515B50|nr:transporter substrate-binding domain-containing protein [Mesorhizobium sp. J428]MCR5859951.1 transporter substrate-binding domain-containing protein [Mesorhizobium sp. J428]